MNRLLMSESTTPIKVRNNRSKRVLQVLQVSASDKDLLVSPNLMSGKEKKPEISQKKTVIFENEQLSKENTPVVPTVRRSKRKNAATQDKTKKATSKEGMETKASANKMSKVTKSNKRSTKKNKQNSSDLKQSKMDSFIASSSTSNTIFESNLENDNDILLEQPKNSVESAVDPNNSVLLDTSLKDSKDSGIGISPEMLTSDNPPEIYWKILAEERRVALEEALRENDRVRYEKEQLYDQIQVLETENSLLKDCLKEAENLAVVLRQALEK